MATADSAHSDSWLLCYSAGSSLLCRSNMATHRKLLESDHFSPDQNRQFIDNFEKTGFTEKRKVKEDSKYFTEKC